MMLPLLACAGATLAIQGESAGTPYVLALKELIQARDASIEDCSWTFRVYHMHADGSEILAEEGRLVSAAHARRLELESSLQSLRLLATWNGTDFLVRSEPLPSPALERGARKPLFELGADPRATFRKGTYPASFGLTFQERPISYWLEHEGLRVLGRRAVGPVDCLELVIVNSRPTRTGGVEAVATARLLLDDHASLLTLQAEALSLLDEGESTLGEVFELEGRFYRHSFRWTVSESEEHNGVWLPRVGYLETTYAGSAALRQVRTEMHFEGPGPSEGAASPRFRQEVPKGFHVRDSITGRTHLHEANHHEGASAGEFDRCLGLLRRHTGMPLKASTGNDPDKWFEISCGVSACYLFLSCYADPGDLAAFVDRLPRGVDTPIPMSELADVIRLHGLEVYAYEGGLDDAAKVRGPVLAHLHEEETAHGHFVLAMAEEGGLRLFEPNLGTTTIDRRDLGKHFSGNLRFLSPRPVEVGSADRSSRRLIALSSSAALLAPDGVQDVLCETGRLRLVNDSETRVLATVHLDEVEGVRVTGYFPGGLGLAEHALAPGEERELICLERATNRITVRSASETSSFELALAGSRRTVLLDDPGGDRR